MDGITIYALDGAFNLVTTDIPYDNLQWNRRYYEAGTFEMQLPMSLYDSSWKYIGSPDRPELGMVQKVYSTEFDMVIVSGFFCEKMLDFRVCFPRYKGEAQSTEAAVRSIFNTYGGGLGIFLGSQNDPPLGDRTQSDFTDDQMGMKIYSILESRELSYRVRYDYEESALFFEVWQGKDRTQSQSANPYQTFSMEFGNIASRTIDFDDSDYRNYAYVPVNGSDDNDYDYVLVINLVPAWGDRREVVIDMRSMSPEDDMSQDEFHQTVANEAAEKMLAFQKVESVDIDVLGTGYLEDFDLGDKCDVVLTDIQVSMETRIVEVNEVFKADGGHTVSAGLGNKRISNLRRAVMS